jgi:sarcosine oxidase/L-pipecolate oxidase
VRRSFENVREIDSKEVAALPTKEDVERVIPGYSAGRDVIWGYVNWGSGWADAEATVRFAKMKAEETGKVEFRAGEVKRLS